MTRHANAALTLAATTLFCVTLAAVGATRTWTGAVDSDWNNAGNWDTGVPVAGDDVVIPAASTVVLNGATPALGTVTIAGTLTHDAQSDVVGTDGWQVDASIQLNCTDLTVPLGGAINANAKGWLGGLAQQTWTEWNLGNRYPGMGPGGGNPQPDWGNGASYAGLGGGNSGSGGTYGSPGDADLPGSGGGSGQSGIRGNGGGLVLVNASGTVSVDGSVTAIGGPGSGHSGAGSGGSINIQAGAITGSGLISAAGGHNSGSNRGGAGGGGRVKLAYTTLTFSGALSVEAGVHTSGGAAPTRGTIWVSDGSLLSATMSGVQLNLYGIASWAPGSGISLTDSVIALNGEGIQVVAAGAIVLDNSSLSLGVKGGTPTTAVAASSISLTDASTLTLYGGDADGLSGGFGGTVTASGNVDVSGGSTLQLTGHPISGGGMQLNACGDVNIGATSAISGNNGGFSGGLQLQNWTDYNNNIRYPGLGPGGGNPQPDWGFGGSYGGTGGGAGTPKPTYGDANLAELPGSGGGSGQSGIRGSGGAKLKLVVGGVLDVEGTLSSDGGGASGHSAGGSGGSVNVEATAITGNGVVSARGGSTASNRGGTGGGGRIKLAAGALTFTGALDPGAGQFTTGAGGRTEATAGSAVTAALAPDCTQFETELYLDAICDALALNPSTSIAGLEADATQPTLDFLAASCVPGADTCLDDLLAYLLSR